MKRNVKLSRPSAQAAFDAWQAGDLQKWIDQFAGGAQLYDDGQPRDFTAFSHEIGRERFTSVDRVSDDGLEIVGDFHSDTWGDFKSYFRFTVDDSGKISKLEIVQV